MRSIKSGTKFVRHYALPALLASVLAAPALGAESINIYSARKEALIKPLLEAYLVALNDLARYRREEKSRKGLTKRLQQRGARMLKQKRIGQPESLSVPVLLAAWENLVQSGIRGSEDDQIIADLTSRLQRFLSRLSP